MKKNKIIALLLVPAFFFGSSKKISPGIRMLLLVMRFDLPTPGIYRFMELNATAPWGRAVKLSLLGYFGGTKMLVCMMTLIIWVLWIWI